MFILHSHLFHLHLEFRKGKWGFQVRNTYMQIAGYIYDLVLHKLHLLNCFSTLHSIRLFCLK